MKQKTPISHYFMTITAKRRSSDSTIVQVQHTYFDVTDVIVLPDPDEELYNLDNDTLVRELRDYTELSHPQNVTGIDPEKYYDALEAYYHDYYVSCLLAAENILGYTKGLSFADRQLKKLDDEASELFGKDHADEAGWVETTKHDA